MTVFVSFSKLPLSRCLPGLASLKRLFYIISTISGYQENRLTPIKILSNFSGIKAKFTCMIIRMMMDVLGLKREDREDLKWVRKAKKGSRGAFEKLVVKHQKRLYFAVRKIVLNHEDTDDIVQDAFIKAYTNLDGFDERHAFYPWLHRIAVNTAINLLSKSSRKMERAMAEGSDDFVSDENAVDDPLQTVIQHELESHIEQALAEIPLEQRTVYILRVSNGLSYQEIGETLGISQGTVMSRLSRAREKLKSALTPYLANENGGKKR